jgi:hypothetical protein
MFKNDGGKDRGKGVLMKNKFLLVALIGVLLAVGMVMFSCGGAACLGGGTSGGAGKCIWDVDTYTAGICDNGTGCAIYDAALELSTETVKCDC